MRYCARASCRRWRHGRTSLPRSARPVSQARLSYFRGIEPAIEAALQTLSAGFSVSLGYLRGWGEGGLAEALRAELEQDARAGATRSGPHRADVAIRCGTEAAATTLSRGQGKMVASALRLAQAQDLMASGRRSLFLIDDVGAELDRDHSQRFYQVLDDMECQIFATSAQSAVHEMLPPPTRRPHVSRETRCYRSSRCLKSKVDCRCRSR